MRILVVLSLILLSSLGAKAHETNCFRSADIVCHLQIYYLYCIDTTNKEITHGANFNGTSQTFLTAPDNPKLGPDFKGSLQTQLEILGADYGDSSGNIIRYYLNLSLSDKKNGPQKIVGKIKVDGNKSGDLDCYLND